MSTETQTTVIKKYANRRLYNTRTSAYVTLDTLAEMVRNGENFVVQDAKTNEDITRGVLGQIIFDAESRGSGLLPISFLRQLITFYGGQLQGLVPTYLEHSLSSFTRDQEKLGRHINQTIGVQAFSAVEDQVRRNMDVFQRSMRMFMPYGAAGEHAEQANADENARTPAPASDRDGLLAKDVAALREELASMQAKIARLGGDEPAAPGASPANDEATIADDVQRPPEKG